MPTRINIVSLYFTISRLGMQCMNESSNTDGYSKLFLPAIILISFCTCGMEFWLNLDPVRSVRKFKKLGRAWPVNNCGSVCAGFDVIWNLRTECVQKRSILTHAQYWSDQRLLSIYQSFQQYSSDALKLPVLEVEQTSSNASLAGSVQHTSDEEEAADIIDERKFSQSVPSSVVCDGCHCCHMCPIMIIICSHRRVRPPRGVPVTFGGA